MNKIIPYFENTISKDLLNIVVGDKLGFGCGREVFEFLPDKSLVIKFEVTGKSFQNAMEWEIWQRVQWVKGIHKWFAPCTQISSCGTILLQKRTYPKDKNKYPEKMPAFFCDTKYSNYGFINDQFVCHDYGTSLLIENGMTSRMKKVNWLG